MDLMRRKFKNIFLFLLAATIIAGCKKNAGKHCPLITESNTGNLVDLSPVKDIKEIMDTLAKYPELQVYSADFEWVHDPGKYHAGVACNIYYKGILIVDQTYQLSVTNYPTISASDTLPIKVNELSIIPNIKREKGESIAFNAIKFSGCAITTLGIKNYSADKTPFYKLVWCVQGAENGYPVVILDAQTGEVYSTFDGFVD